MAAGRGGGEDISSSSSSMRGQVTITLGRSGGQVVKRSGGGELEEEEEEAGRRVAVGSKRRSSVRDRLGAAAPSSSHLLLHNKRLCGDNGSYSVNPTNFIDDFHLSKDDLRYKIIKQTQTNTQHKIVDLRDMLSRRARPSITKPDTPPTLSDPGHGRHKVPEIIPVIRDDRRRDPDPRDNPRRMPEPRNERHSMPEPRVERQHMPDTLDERRRLSQPMDDRRRVPESRDDRRRVAEYREDRPTMPEPRDGRQSMPELLEVRQRIPKVSDTRQSSVPDGSMTRHFTSMRASEAPSQMDFLTSSYSPWTLDHIRRKSPDRVLNTSRGLSPPQRTEEPQRRPIMRARAYEDSRSMQYSSRDGSDISRPMSTTSFLTKPSLSAGPTKPVGPMVAPPIPPVGNMQRSQYPVEHLTVEGFLRSLGLEKYLISFKVEEVDMAALSQMGDHDLKELGIPMGPRKKILLALLARTRRQVR